MLLDTTNTDDLINLEPAQPAGPAANLSDQPEPKRPPQALLAAARRCPKPDGRDRSVGENGDRYPGRIFEVPGTNWRVVVCAEGRQYIAQQREGRDRWTSRKFFTNRRRLGVVLRQLVGARAFRAVEATIAALPI